MKKRSTNDISTYAQMGMAALLPGMQYMLEQMQHQLDEFRGMLAGAQRPKAGNRINAGKGTWAGMSREERSVEMKRRRAVAEEKKRVAAKMHPRDPRHPGHDAWTEQMRKTNRDSWKKLTPAQRRDRTARMVAGRKAAVVKLAVAS